MKRHEVTDELVETDSAHFPEGTATTGRQPSDPRVMLNGFLWILRPGSPWRDLPERFGPWRTVYDHFSNLRKKGVYDRILEALRIRLDADGAIDWELWCIDGSSVRASRAAAGASKQVASVTQTSRKTTLWAGRESDSAASSKWLLTVEVTAGQGHDSTCIEPVMDQIAVPQPVGRPRKRPKQLAGDKGPSSNHVRSWLRKDGISR